MIGPRSFAETVTRALASVTRDFGFVTEETGDYRVLFRSGYHFLQVDYDARHSNELSIWVGEASASRSPLGLGDILRATDCPPIKIAGIEGTQPGDEHALEQVLKRAARLLALYGIPFLSGNPLAFASAEAFRHDREHQMTARILAMGPQAEADMAWQKKEYETVCRLLEPIRDSLDALHKRRLDFAEQRQRGDCQRGVEDMT